MQWLSHIIGTMPPDSWLRLHKELELRVKAKLEELARAQPGMSKNNHTQHKRRWTTFRDLLDNAAVITSVPGENKCTTWYSNLGAAFTSADRLAPQDVCSTCSATGAWVSEGCSPDSGTFAIAPATTLDPMRWRSQFNHAMKCDSLRNLPMQSIQQDHKLRGVISETRPAIFWVGADGAPMLDRTCCSKEGGARSITDNAGTWTA